MNSLRATDELLVTPEGHAHLCADLQKLRIDGRRGIAERLQEARADGHLNDNPALFDALEEQAQLERRIAILESRLATARIAEPRHDGIAGFGSVVRVRDVDTKESAEYELVGPIEANAAHGRLSVEAPVGRALLGKGAGDDVVVPCPRGEVRFEVIDVRGARAHAEPRLAA